jgi:hypothetical protein
MDSVRPCRALRALLCVVQVAETCQMALQRIEYLAANPQAADEASPYYSVDPAPAAPATTPVPELRDQLLDEGRRMFDVRGCVRAGGQAGGRAATRICVTGVVPAGRCSVGYHGQGVLLSRCGEGCHVSTSAAVGQGDALNDESPAHACLHKQCPRIPASITMGARARAASLMP